jgi:hypothetical protein
MVSLACTQARLAGPAAKAASAFLSCSGRAGLLRHILLRSLPGRIATHNLVPWVLFEVVNQGQQ